MAFLTGMDVHGVVAHTGEVHIFTDEGAQRDGAEDRGVERVDIGVISLRRVQLSEIKVQAHHDRVEGLADLEGDVVGNRGVRQRIVQTDDVDVGVRVDVMDHFDDGGVVRVELVETAEGGFRDDFQCVLDAVDLGDRFGEFDDHVILGAVLLQQVFDDPVFVILLSKIGRILRVNGSIQRHDDRELDVVRAEVDRDEVGLGDLFSDFFLKIRVLRVCQFLISTCHSLRQRFGELTVVIVVGRVQGLTEFGSPPAAVGFVVIVLVVLVDADAFGNEIRVGSGNTHAFCGTTFCVFGYIKI